MRIDENTRYIARLHKSASPRGLNIYNPFFDEADLNALYILFYNEDPKVLLDGIKSLKFLGGISAGFESDPALPQLLDELDEVSRIVGKVGYIKLENGKLVGKLQSGEGLLRAIQEKVDINNKELVIVGAGNVSKALLAVISLKGLNPKSVKLLNRTVESAESVASNTDLNIEPLSFKELENVSGDVLVNVTDIGGKVEDMFYTKSIVDKFECVADVTFEKEDTNLTRLGRELGKKVSTGWDMFTNQGMVIMEDLFEQHLDVELLRKHVKRGLSEVVT